MPELFPSHLAAGLKTGLRDYLSTTFSLTDRQTESALIALFDDREDGLFQGPFVRTRLPFRPDPDGEKALDWAPGNFAPYGHQAAAYRRLSTKSPEGPHRLRRPDPTLVVTGTGSGKTEAFLHPILDHVIRATKLGLTGTKAIILYPMNALAKDQADRLADMIASRPELRGVRAALYTGADTGNRTLTSARGLITDRTTIRQDPPDILLTNYKMLDNLLLRSEDASLWKESATSLQYLVLDEFHTYDGAQGTDVSMLLRRLGLALKSHWPAQLPDGRSGLVPEDRERPLGRMTPVATSATLGDKGDPTQMLEFASRVFGEEFTADSVITESRVSVEEWSQAAAWNPLGQKERLARLAEAASHVDRAVHGEGTLEESAYLEAVLEHYGPLSLGVSAEGAADLALEDFLGSTVFRGLIERTQEAVSLEDLTASFIPAETVPGVSAAVREQVVTDLLALLSHGRFLFGRAMPTVENHLWVRELSRLDRSVSMGVTFRWADEGEPLGSEDEAQQWLPAIFCRFCGRSGWGGLLKPSGTDLVMDGDAVRRAPMRRLPEFRPLMHAAGEASSFRENPEAKVPAGFMWLNAEQQLLSSDVPAEDDPQMLAGRIVPVLTLDPADPDVGDHAKDQMCPVCHAKDAVRFVGSAVATMLSVTISNMFSTGDLDQGEKKALIFTDSVQDAAHRAGFVQARSHSLTLRTAIRSVLEEQPCSLVELASDVVSSSNFEAKERFQLLPPELVRHENFIGFWDSSVKVDRRERSRIQDRVRVRMQFDASLEFGLQSSTGRTLERTGAASAWVDAGGVSALHQAALKAYDQTARQTSTEALEGLSQAELVRWARGLLERIRTQGGIDHVWLRAFIRDEGKRYSIWGGRPKDQGMPAFPQGRPAPSFPRVGKSSSHYFDSVERTSTWYAQWTAKALRVKPQDAAFMVRRLLQELAESGVLKASTTSTGATVYSLPPERVLVCAESDPAMLQCSRCKVTLTAGPVAREQLSGAPCTQRDCTGTLGVVPIGQNYYRDLYASPQLERVVSREHSSLIEDRERTLLEDAFKNSADRPDAPNVLVATPTLEMGIDIGDLSCVILASLPRTVSSYVQRVGRAGRLTGNSLVLAFVRGRGEHLPKLHDPLSVINGSVLPPATFLNAEEILRRQFLAFVADTMARFGDPRCVPGPPRQVFSEDENGYLSLLLAKVAEEKDSLVPQFIGSFGEHLETETVERFHEWVSGVSEDESSLTGMVFMAIRRWQAEVAELRRRRHAVEEDLPRLQAEVERANPDTQDKEAYQRAVAMRSFLTKQIARFDGQKYWISSLEEAGIFPNYTLLDDAVDLTVNERWRDPGTQQFEYTPHELQRGAGAALSELAPGSFFYARQMEIRVDSAELGADQSNLERWQLCPVCGWANTQVHLTGTVTSCGACGAGDIADVSTLIDVLPLTKVSATVDRDENKIGDSRDERQKAVYHLVPSVEIDESKDLRQRWFVTQSGFGVDSLRAITLRWLNVGPANVGGTERIIAGEKVDTPLFRLCRRCGKLDGTADENSPRSHQPWCPLRKAAEKDTVSVALSRTLRTQATVFYLPAHVAEESASALPSLKAAILLGLRAMLGGDPTHLALQDATVSLDGAPRTAIILHDTVPGGTGYLAGVASPVDVWSLLHRAWETVRTCECQHEARSACHRCLLGVTTHAASKNVDRATAETLLRVLLTGEAHPEETDHLEPGSWGEITAEAVTVDTEESHIEKRFRKDFLARLARNGWIIREIPRPYGTEATIRHASRADLIWTLRPQFLHEAAGTKVDFILRHPDPDVKDIAIYTDGYAFHATQSHNRVGDDAGKRARLRQSGLIPWAVTSADLDDFNAGLNQRTAVWFDDRMKERVGGSGAVATGILDGLGSNAVTRLLPWLDQPKDSSWTTSSVSSAFYLLRDGSRGHVDAAKLGQWAAALLDDPQAPVPAGDSVGLAHVSPHLVLAAAYKDSQLRLELVLDDSPEAVADPGYREVWQEWLRLSNLLVFWEGFTATTRSELERAESSGSSAVPRPSSPQTESAETALSGAWGEVKSLATDDEWQLLSGLTEDDSLVPELGFELDSGTPVDIAWPEEKIALITDVVASADVRDELSALGWTLLAPDTPDLRTRLLEMKDTAHG